MGSSPVPGWVTNPVIVCGHRTSAEAAAVLIGVEDVETLEILSDSTLMDDIRTSLREIASGETHPVEEIYPDAVPGPSDQTR